MAPSLRALAFADAKATESPGCHATAARLRWYVIAAHELGGQFASATVVLAVDQGTERAWRRMLLSAAVPRRLGVVTASTAVVGDMAVVSVPLRLRNRDRSSTYPVWPCQPGVLDDPCAESTSFAGPGG